MTRRRLDAGDALLVGFPAILAAIFLPAAGFCAAAGEWDGVGIVGGVGLYMVALAVAAYRIASRP